MTHSVDTDCTGYTTGGMPGSSPFTYRQGDACSTILVRGSIPRTQLPCGEQPPVQECSPLTPHLCTPSVDPMEPPATCRDVSFHVEAFAGEASLFTEDGAPHLIERGTLKGALSFTPRSGVTGEARFRVSMQKAGMGAGESAQANAASRRLLVAPNSPIVREFVISVLPVNDAPVIRRTYDVSVVSGSGINFTEVFASDIVAEVPGPLFLHSSSGKIRACVLWHEEAAPRVSAAIKGGAHDGRWRGALCARAVAHGGGAQGELHAHHLYHAGVARQGITQGQLLLLLV